MPDSRLYHRRPLNLWGTILYPLNDLRQVMPELYQQQVQKYKGREALLEQRVGHLNCLWNDVLHLSPVHPAQLAEAVVAAGLSWAPQEWFEIDPLAAGFAPTNTAVFLYQDVDYSLPFGSDEF